VIAISSKAVKTRKPHKCWGCTKEIPIGTEVARSTSVDGDRISSVYWCNTCVKYMDEHLDSWDMQDGFEYGVLREYEDYPGGDQ
jgi:hypothetical protein